MDPRVRDVILEVSRLGGHSFTKYTEHSDGDPIDILVEVVEHLIDEIVGR